ncbi:MAG: protease modulator HflC [Pseudomonadota bacterium]
MRAGLIALSIAVVGIIFVVLNSVFIVNPMQQALVLRFGEVQQAIREPGLNFKLPPPFEDVQFLDKRVLDLNVPAQEIIAADQKRLVVDAFMRYRIADPVRFFQTVNNVREGSLRLSTFAQSSLRAVLADATFTDIVRDNRDSLMNRITQQVAVNAQGIGVQVVDVKIRRADLPETNSEAIFRRMQTEREQEAAQIRAEGGEAARRIVAAAERESTVLQAEAQREAEQIRGQGDGQRNAIFASAFSQDPEFFAFYRAMQAYEASLAANDTRLVLSPDADFFRFFNDPLGVSRRASDAPAAPVTPAPMIAPAEEVVEGVEADEAASLTEEPQPNETAAAAIEAVEEETASAMEAAERASSILASAAAQESQREAGGVGDEAAAVVEATSSFDEPSLAAAEADADTTTTVE